MVLFVSIGMAWAVDYTELYSCDFTTVANHSYTQNKTFTLGEKEWKSSVSQVNGGVFYLGCNSTHAAKGVLNDNSDFADIVTALADTDAVYNTNKATAHAYALLFDNNYDAVTKVTFGWAGGNNAFQVFLFGYTNSAWTLLDSTNYATSGTAIAGSLEWTGDATDFDEFAIVARPGAKNTTATNKTLRAASFAIYKTAAEPDPTTKDYYLTLSSDWASWPAKYAVYYFKSADDSQNGWTAFMTEVEGETNTYKVAVPLGYDKIIFARINSTATEPNWTDKWSQTVNLDAQADPKNHFTVTSGGTGDECNGTWGTFTPTVYADVYFVNKDEWAEDKIYLFGWEGEVNNGWPGVVMTKTANTLFGYDVFKGQINEDFTNVIISEDGSETKRSGDQVFDKEKPYFFDGAWYATLGEIPANCAIINGSANGTSITLKAGAVVVFAEGKYAFVKDASGAAMIYKDGFGLTTGDTILVNIPGSVTVYKNLPEFVPTAATIAEADVKAGKAPEIADATEEPKATNLNQVVVFKNVTFASSEYSSKSITGTWGETEVKFYDQFGKNIAFDTEKKYNITAALSVYNTTYQAYIIAAEAVCQDGPYAILVNGETRVPTIAQTGDEEYDASGRKQYLAYLSLTKDDSIQVINTSCDATFLPEIEDAGVGAHFKKGVNAAKVDSTGCYNLYLKLKSEDNKLYIGEGICPEDTIRYYVVGEGEKFGNWTPNVIASKKDTFVIADLEPGKYKFRLSLDGTWEHTVGFSNMTDTAAGLEVGDDNNIVFRFTEKHDLTIVYGKDNENKPVFKLIGDFYVHVPVLKQLKFVAREFANDNAKLAAYLEDKDGLLDDAWTAFFAPISEGNDTLVASIDAAYDSIQFVRFKTEADAPKWDGGEGYIWNMIARDSINYESLTYTFIKYVDFLCEGTWDVYYPNPYIETYFATGDGWTKDTESNLVWDGKNQKAIITIAQAKNIQWQAQAKYQAIPAVKGKTYDISMKLLADKDVDGITIKYQDNDDNEFEVLYENQSISLKKDVELVYAKTELDAWKESGGNGVLVFDFGHTPAGTHITISDVQIVERDATPAKFYITGDSALIVDGGQAQKYAWRPYAFKALKDTFVLENLKADQDYILKVTMNGTWAGENNVKGYNELTEKTPGLDDVSDDHNIGFKLNAAGDVKVIYIAGETPVFKLQGDFYVKPAPVLANGYYLVGKFSGVDAWSVEDLSDAKLFVVNPDNDKEYQLSYTFAVGDSIKVVEVEDDAIKTWFPAGANYGIDDHHNGATTVYFRPDYQGGEGWHEACIYVVPTSTVDIDITNDGIHAVKVLRNGQIFILKGDKTYNGQGQLVK